MEKCPMCSGGLKVIKTPFEYADVLFGEYDSEVCTKCGEIFFTEASSDAIDKKAKELNLWGIEKKTKIAYAGNSLIVRIPKEIANMLNLSKGKEVIIRTEGKRRIVITIS
ncbi:MAG: AbrB/MazE/SpoVT family DNA-binding domain-containing protein [Candidatus Thermoplasmatota archaeon]